jgi:hypothetical protein
LHPTSGLPDGIFWVPKIHIWVYIMAISKMLWRFGIFCAHQVCIFPLWCVVPRKIWQPRLTYFLSTKLSPVLIPFKVAGDRTRAPWISVYFLTALPQLLPALSYCLLVNLIICFIGVGYDHNRDQSFFFMFSTQLFT